MKKFRFLLVMLVLVLPFGLAFLSCDNGTTGGGGGGGASTFTLTGIPSQYNGKYAMVQAQSASGVSIYGYQSLSNAGVATLVPISNGRANIPLKVATTGFNYTGTEAVHVAFAIYNQATGSEFNEALAVIWFNAVPFTNGSATKSWADGTVQ